MNTARRGGWMLPRNWCENPFKTAVSSLSTARPRAHFGLLRNWGARPPRAQRRTPSSAAASAPARAGTRASSSISTPRVSPLWTFTRTLPVPGHRYLRQRIIQGKFPPPSLNAAPPFGVRRQSVAATALSNAVARPLPKRCRAALATALHKPPENRRFMGAMREKISGRPHL